MDNSCILNIENFQSISNEDCDDILKCNQVQNSKDLKEQNAHISVNISDDSLKLALHDSPNIVLEAAKQSEGRVQRRCKKKIYSSYKCPLCGITVRVQELQLHFQHEIEKLAKIGRNSKRASRNVIPLNESFLQAKLSRQNRLAAKANKARKKKEATCPICNSNLNGTTEELTIHVEQCLKKKESFDSEDEEDVDVDGETYEWAGQTRIRATTLLEGNYSDSGFHVNKQNDNEDDDQDLNVDIDDTATYGQPQYTEADVIPYTVDEPAEEKERQQLRKALLKNSPAPQRTFSQSKWLNSSDNETKNGTSNDDERNQSRETEIISSLKEKIRDLEGMHLTLERMKCLICMEPYTKPVVSISCWHVHCEECWLRTLGVKKLCPQCNMITSPGNLRRIYL